ncbi:NupC/NupG family nucleoside CNT transporter [Corynebacterium pseudotuberculosis]|uniref:NupC/NupG family nucleoside CNT transporter n=1 Tax=Corynebacterium pseudotuberculosis (strain C231) TaxID=681645 RepID=D9QD06_CORP2|nr:nucleoside transporter C-terminal domain-containing protein [Corynebacterium pseudotuberculosis]ADK29786.1 NupC/NupG family nucleoside CNT transporter [Corynebacterium pseudotuberculosis FRC41]ADL11432.1 NupC/NupG family nucleoside CNT transporter [Corynebacterium pseudotuberculosis C231]ADL21844.1 NupC/NupG family nucleoside CNT transporter [Corynebacterium pseudotuberculosis 1002]ADO27242.1 NupC/NupG family nucleoside CNT transporter [Corynebacterium pseudotuberculosis I19]AEK93302.1 Nucl
MERLQGLLGIVAILGLLILFSRARKQINWRTLGVGLALQVLLSLLVLKWSVGFNAVKSVSKGLQKLTDFTNEGTAFVFGSLFSTENSFVFALNVLPVIIFLGAIIGALYYFRIIQFFVDIVGGALKWLLGTSKVESVWAATVIFLGQSEAPLVIQPYLKKLTRSELFTCMTGGFASVAGATIIGYSLLGAPLEYLLAASVMNAPGSILVAKAFMPETEKTTLDANVRNVRDTESKNVVDAIGRGAMSGGQIAIAVGCLLIAFIATISMLSAILGGIGSLFGQEGWSLEGLFGILFSPVAWLIGVPWSEAHLVGSFIGEKTIINEFVGYTSFGANLENLSPKSIMISTFALAGFANISSIAIQIGALGGLVPERRGEVAKLAPIALITGFATNMLNAAIVGVVAI